LRAVFAKSFARIHARNLANFGILALSFESPGDWDAIHPGDVLRLDDLQKTLKSGRRVRVENLTRGSVYTLVHRLSARQLEMVLAGGLINAIRQRT